MDLLADQDMVIAKAHPKLIPPPTALLNIKISSTGKTARKAMFPLTARAGRNSGRFICRTTAAQPVVNHIEPAANTVQYGPEYGLIGRPGYCYGKSATKSNAALHRSILYRSIHHTDLPQTE
jgi:hypothetical protein